MDILIVSLAALGAAALTLFSGFGLGTLLMPVVAIFFPMEVAIGVTAIVHLANNLFKVVLLGRNADRSVLLAFGIPAVIAAFAGALVLVWVSGAGSLFEYTAFGRYMQVSPVKLVIGSLILVFVGLELWPRFSALALDRKFIPLGGLISGFFGGLSGHQGAFRSMFLLKAGLDKTAFVATGVMIAVLVDMSRILVYGWDLRARSLDVEWPLVGSACLAAFAGSFIGSRILKKITIKSVQILVSGLLLILALGFVTGVF
ncbi:MAG: sulfite exporter TauE/SafE family protein [Deltaproteobacteria bacterium]|nr:sulfite exporter TauE/SafE family protein [Deltaproteobacteria bacterium]